MMPMGSALPDLFSGGKPVWPRILGTIIAVPILAVIDGRKTGAPAGATSPADRDHVRLWWFQQPSSDFLPALRW